MYLNNLKNLREQYEYTQKDIANKLNCKQSTYDNWERQVVMIPIEIADELSLIYNVPISYILGMTSESKYKNIKKMNYDLLIKNLNDLKNKNNYSSRYIANKLQCNHTTILRYLNNKIVIPIDRLIMFSQLYNVDIDKLCGKI